MLGLLGGILPQLLEQLIHRREGSDSPDAQPAQKQQGADDPEHDAGPPGGGQGARDGAVITNWNGTLRRGKRLRVIAH